MRQSFGTSFRKWLVALAAIAGCAESNAPHLSAPAETGEMVVARGSAVDAEMAGQLAQVDDLAAADADATTAPGLARKIVYSANVELVVEDFSGVEESVAALVKRFDGYVADSSLSGTAGENRRATWRIRVPVARFEEFVDAAKNLGELTSAGTTSQDVSEEYYDVEARIRNKTKEEERLLTLLEERPGKLEDVIAIERELSRVREELEQMQGRMRVLADLTTMTTVHLTIAEIRNYEPPRAATLATRVRRALDGSLVALRTAGEATLIALVAASPWLGVLLVPAVAIYLAARVVRRRRV